jgi:hypothetical protein
MKALLLAHIAATLLMTGVILFVQLVHYPLFNRVGTSAFTAYEAAHTSAITCLVMPLMLVELFTALLLAVQPPQGVSPLIFWIGFGLVLVIWCSTTFLQVPQHGRLSTGFDEAAYRALVMTNWVRTVAWCIRAALMLFVLAQLLALPTSGTS